MRRPVRADRHPARVRGAPSVLWRIEVRNDGVDAAHRDPRPGAARARRALGGRLGLALRHAVERRSLPRLLRDRADPAGGARRRPAAGATARRTTPRHPTRQPASARHPARRGRRADAAGVRAARPLDLRLRPHPRAGGAAESCPGSRSPRPTATVSAFAAVRAPTPLDELRLDPVFLGDGATLAFEFEALGPDAQTGVILTHGNHPDSLQLGLHDGRVWLALGGERVSASRTTHIRFAPDRGCGQRGRRRARHRRARSRAHRGRGGAASDGPRPSKAGRCSSWTPPRRPGRRTRFASAPDRTRGGGAACLGALERRARAPVRPHPCRSVLTSATTRMRCSPRRAPAPPGRTPSIRGGRRSLAASCGATPSRPAIPTTRATCRC